MDGVIVINKPKGYTAHDIVGILRKKLNIKQIGHAGTLDPNATGVLPILVGKATKISKYLIEHDKTYVAKLKLGEKRTTGDSEGEVVERMPVEQYDMEQVKTILSSFIGKQEQVPPIYSAIKVEGKKLYEYARAGQDVEIKKRNIEIYNIELIDLENDEITFEVSCSKGTYIRTLCEDIAVKLGTVGYMKELNRTRVNDFTLNDTVKIDDDINNARIFTIEEIFKNSLNIILNDKELQAFLNGVKLERKFNDCVVKIYDRNNTFIGLGTIKDSKLKRDVIL